MEFRPRNVSAEESAGVRRFLTYSDAARALERGKAMMHSRNRAERAEGRVVVAEAEAVVDSAYSDLEAIAERFPVCAALIERHYLDGVVWLDVASECGESIDRCKKCCLYAIGAVFDGIHLRKRDGMPAMVGKFERDITRRVTPGRQPCLH